jgi:hypothetical protein
MIISCSSSTINLRVGYHGEIELLLHNGSEEEWPGIQGVLSLPCSVTRSVTPSDRMQTGGLGPVSPPDLLRCLLRAKGM